MMSHTPDGMMGKPMEDEMGPMSDETKNKVDSIVIKKLDDGTFKYQVYEKMDKGEDVGSKMASYEFNNAEDVLNAVKDDLCTPHMKKKPPLGSGERFSMLVSKIESRPGFKGDAAAIAASVGRKKYGKERFQKLAASGRKKFISGKVFK